MGVKTVTPTLLCGVAFVLLLSGVTGQDQGGGGAKTFTAVGVPPDDSKQVGDSALLVVKFGNNNEIAPEKPIPQPIVASQPMVKFPGAKLLTKYTLFIINLYKNNTHWLVANIPGTFLRNGVSPQPGSDSEGNTLLPYQAPNPMDTKLNRYFCLVFAQEKGSNSIIAPPSRKQNFPEFCTLNSLKTPQAAGNTFLIQGSGTSRK